MKQLSIKATSNRLIGEEIKSLSALCKALEIKLPKDSQKMETFAYVVKKLIEVTKDEQGKFHISKLNPFYDVILTPDEYLKEEKLIERYSIVFFEKGKRVVAEVSNERFLMYGNNNIVTLIHAGLEVDDIF